MKASLTSTHVQGLELLLAEQEDHFQIQKNGTAPELVYYSECRRHRRTLKTLIAYMH